MLHAVAVLALVLFSVAATASDASVVLVYQGKSGYQNVFVARFKERLKLNTTLLELDADSDDLSAQLEQVDGTARYIVAVGSRAATRIDAITLTTPTLYALITREKHQTLTSGANRRHSALYVEQPFSRMARLLSIALPDVEKVGVVLSERSLALEDELRAVSGRYPFEPVIRVANGTDTLHSALESLYSEVQVLLSLPDSKIINRRSVKNYLLGAYLRKIPVLGYSRTLVKAGALLAVYSTPDQIGAQAAGITNRVLEHGYPQEQLAYYPQEYLVAVNYQVARALGVDIASEEVLLDMLREQEAETK